MSQLNGWIHGPILGWIDSGLRGKGGNIDTSQSTFAMAFTYAIAEITWQTKRQSSFVCFQVLDSITSLRSIPQKNTFG